MDQVLFIDFQGFYVSYPYRHYVIKELSLLSPYRSDLFIFKPPFDKKKLSFDNQIGDIQTMINVHGFEWDDGSCPYVCLQEIIKERCGKVGKIYVSSIEKANVLQEIVKKPIYTFEKDLNVKLRDMENSKVKCWYDHNGYECAYKNTDKLMTWFMLYYSF